MHQRFKMLFLLSQTAEVLVLLLSDARGEGINLLPGHKIFVQHMGEDFQRGFELFGNDLVGAQLLEWAYLP